MAESLRTNNSVVLRHGEKVEQLYKVPSPCLDDHQIKKEELESVGELSEVWSHIVWKCLYLARIGRPDILWSANKPARTVTKWTKACDKRLPRMISYIQHTNDFRQYCHVGVDTSPSCTRANAYFLVRTSQCAIHTALHFSNEGTPHWFKVKRICVAYFCIWFHLVCHVFVGRSVCPIHPSHVFTHMLIGKTFNVPNLVWWKWTKPWCFHSLEWNDWLPCQSDSKIGYESNFHSCMNEEHTPITFSLRGYHTALNRLC